MYILLWENDFQGVGGSQINLYIWTVQCTDNLYLYFACGFFCNLQTSQRLNRTGPKFFVGPHMGPVKVFEKIYTPVFINIKFLFFIFQLNRWQITWRVYACPRRILRSWKWSDEELLERFVLSKWNIRIRWVSIKRIFKLINILK